MPSLYARWMHNWETRLTHVDNNRVVRPMEWGIEWTRGWPCRNGSMSTQTPEECEAYLRTYNSRAVASSDEFFSYNVPSDFRLDSRRRYARLIRKTTSLMPAGSRRRKARALS